MQSANSITKKFILLLIVLSGCAVISVIKPRLPAPHPVSGGILFQFYAPVAKRVTLAGNFNRWGGTADGRYDPNIDQMFDDGTHGDKVAGDGVWSLIIFLPPGTYQYKYVVDSNAWYTDPNNPLTVVEGGFTNSKLIVK